MIKFNKSTLTEIAGLGAGAVAGAYVSQKVLTKADGTYLVGSGTTGKLVADLAPIAVGLLLQGQSNTFAKEAGKGMIAQAAGGFIKSKFPALGITGDGDYMGEGTMMSGLDTGVDNPMISAVPSDSSYVAPSIGAAYYDDGAEAAY
jgi:hypothetical protein